MLIGTLRNPTAAPIPVPGSELAPGEERCILLSFDQFRPVFDWNTPFEMGAEALNFSGEPLPTSDAIMGAHWVQALAQKFTTSLEGRALWNIEIQSRLFCAVRVEILQTKLADFGTSWQAVTQKLSPVAGLLQLGMLNEARGALLVTITDDYLTPERLGRWAQMVAAADAIIRED